MRQEYTVSIIYLSSAEGFLWRNPIGFHMLYHHMDLFPTTKEILLFSELHIPTKWKNEQSLIMFQDKLNNAFQSVLFTVMQQFYLILSFKF